VTSTTVDPDIQTLLDALAAMGGPSLAEMGPETARAMFKAISVVTTGPEVALVEDRTAPGVGGDIPVRVYRPEGDGPHPLLVWYHGGGFVIGDLDTADSTARELTSRAGCIVVSVDYRLAPEHPYPAAAEDAWSALVWAVEHAAELGADPDRVAVGGDSAGGNLAAVTAIRARDEGVALRHQLLVYPVTDLAATFPSRVSNGEGYFLTKDAMEWFETSYLGDHEPHDPEVSPLYADVVRLPPAHVITAGFDPLRDEGEAYAASLRSAGVEVLDDRYPTMIHGFFGMTTTTKVAGEALDRAAEQLRAAFGTSG
jgi:acetyl esterase